MPKALFDIQPLLAELAQDTTLLTPNNRLRNQIRLAYNHAVEQKIVRVPKIYSLDEWINARWQTLSYQAHADTNAVILNEIQLETIWLDILAKSDFADPSANFSVLAGQLIQAYRYLELWNVPFSELTLCSVSSGQLRDSEKLRKWFEAFDEQLSRINAITNERRQTVLLKAQQENILPSLPAICLQGFDDLPPRTQALINAATNKIIAPKNKSHQSPTACRVECTNLFEEAKSAALWTQQIITQNPEASVGIIVPNLGKERQTIERAFIEVLEPQYLDPKTSRYTLPFNISAGTPLASTAIISDTLLLLRLSDHELPLNDWIRILNSPFFGDLKHENAIRIRLLEHIKNQRNFSVRGASVREFAQYVAEQTTDSIVAAFSHRLQLYADYQRQHADPTTVDAWIQRIKTQLTLIGWPGTRKLDSVEYQQVTQWFQLLEQLSCLNLRNKPLTQNEVLKTLSSLASKTHFQAEVKSSPIYILGSLEGAGLEFDFCWIMGMNNQEWPPRPTPNPLLPLSLQRHYQLPRASLERETRYAKSITEQLLHCAPTIVVSYGGQDENIESTPSALIDHLPATSLPDILSTTSTLLETYQHPLSFPELEWVLCEKGPALSVNSSTPVQGGSDLLKQQALCPFNGFARYRLHAKPVDKPTLGLSPLDKGNIIHGTLDLLWKKIGDSKTLSVMDEAELTALVAHCVEQTFVFALKRNIKELGDFYYQLEQQRFTQLLLRWLTSEKERADFTVVAREAELNTVFAGLMFKLRIDRVDQLDNGELLLIDYKTGNAKAKKLCGPRIEEPQLPLYLLCYPEPVSGIAFATVNNKEPGFTGVGNIQNNQGLKLDSTEKLMKLEQWEDAILYFRSELETLAQEFRDGYCTVEFKHSEAARYSGELAPLNRMAEQDYVRYRFSNSSLVTSNSTQPGGEE